jgi:hypothetical protein
LTVMILGSTAFAGTIQCISITPRYNLEVFLPDSSEVVEVRNGKEILHYRLSPASAQKNRKQLPVVLQSEAGDMILKLVPNPNGGAVVGAIKLRVLDESVPLNCRYVNTQYNENF